MKIIGTDIQMIRGDSETITLTLSNRDNEFVAFEEGDTIYFTLKENIRRNETLIHKEITEFVDGKAIISIEPEDTHNLRPKDDYVYDIQLTEKNGKITTIVGPSNFSIIGDVTRV